MTPEVYSWVARGHGLVATLGLALLLHPVITIRTRGVLTRRMVWTAEIAAVLLAVPFAVGWWLYPTYIAQVKAPLWLAHPQAVLRFETKEHLAAMSLALAVAGAIVLRAAGGGTAGRETGWMLLLCAWALGVVTALLGVFVSGSAHPGW